MIRKRVSATGKVAYQVRVRSGGRGSREITRTYPTRRQATEAEARLVAQLAQRRELGVHAPAPASSERLEDWLEAWFTSNRGLWARSTAIARGSLLDRWVVPYIGAVPLRELGAERLTAWRDQAIADGGSPHNVANAMRVVSSALSAAVDHGKLPANPMRRVKRPRPPQREVLALSAEQAERIRAALPTMVDRVLWGLQYGAGLRTSEAHALGWDDVLGLTHHGGTLRVRAAYVQGELRNSTKTGRARDVPVVGPLASDLMTLRELTAARPCDLVCPSAAGTPINPNNWRARVFDPARRAAGVEFATPKLGRKTYISLQIHAGMSPVLVAAYAGHSTAVLWNNYAREFDLARGTVPVQLDEALRAARRAANDDGCAATVRPRAVPDEAAQTTKAPR